MTDKQKPGVLLRYSSEHARDALSQWLEPDFRNLPCASDEEAVAALSDPEQRLTALNPDYYTHIRAHETKANIV